MIPSLPMFISRAGHITDDAKKGYLYAEMWLYQLEQALEQGTRTIQKLLSEVEQQLVQLPAVAVISDISSTSPVDWRYSVNLLLVINVSGYSSGLINLLCVYCRESIMVLFPVSNVTRSLN